MHDRLVVDQSILAEDKDLLFMHDSIPLSPHAGQAPNLQSLLPPTIIRLDIKIGIWVLILVAHYGWTRLGIGI